MQVQSAYASGMQGLQSAQQGLAQATTSVATPDEQKPAVPQDTVTLSSQAVSQSNTATALISATESVNQAQASTKVIEAASESIGSLIDIEV
ncbi:chemotaxis protein [Shewanella inventionis]|uniref:Chemotaxis protein n=1 Tax=Shewanella inventionis TaxID=1738770 RepID=A0ABQ1IR38_9GAMM|nr:chemotaxis protein [Shewanella inventionis]MCL1157218.1 chemotaxis protein [Shewanella inventionis]UAL45385.1 chemotaxis protein [Shewanella inventionis]GGB48949.1 chemotaxis protein [Shewanella inventionis]